MKSRALQARGYIEVVRELPRVIATALPPAVMDEDAELTRLAGELTTALKAKKTDDSKELRRRLFALQRVLAGRLT